MKDHSIEWEHFDHEADIGVRGFGPTPAAAFAQAALAMIAVVSDPQSIKPSQAVTIECNANDLEVLFVDWLNSLVYEMATRKMLFSRFVIEIKDHSLHAVAWGENIDVARHQPAVEIKGATYTSLHVTQDDTGRWTAQTVVDV